MREALLQHLFDTWPRIFAPYRSGLVFLPQEQRITCDDGWFPIIDTLCEALQWETDHAGAPQVVVAQVKSKLGSMRVAAPGRQSECQSGMIRMALMLSALIPEDHVWPAGVMPENHARKGNMLQHGADSIIRIARQGAGHIVIGDDLATDAVIRIIKRTSVPLTLKAGKRSGDSLARIAQAGGNRITLDFS